MCRYWIELARLPLLLISITKEELIYSLKHQMDCLPKKEKVWPGGRWINILIVVFIALDSFIKLEGVPVDELVIKPHIAKDRRHYSKPNTAVLFAEGNQKLKDAVTLIKFVIICNPLVILLLLLIVIFVAFYLFIA